MQGFALLSPTYLSLTKVPAEPAGGEGRDLFERTRFFEQMRRAGDDHQLFFAFQQRVRLPVEIDHDIVVTANY
ncbi:MAG: hypothetical protein A2150_06105 [Candidatus Muproteobacteria bacterium RBG_16_64_11]|uniref:Uncharacterized protein n=1 Tax=Candidatus Muproteobacteria bacterium RBG_16_64_11 TaxID=1817758 RepID=A0A1F6TGY5_9PROT|nr:MAG: hypothetical protein A2150_06105 [Candidatus Muproteobacteria bacterium RBG_16_64_11]